MGEYSIPKNSSKPPGRSAKTRPKKVIFGIDEMPAVPPENAVQLMRIVRMISPKASVTMAR